MSALDWNDNPDTIVRRLATIGCTNEEIAGVVGCSINWLRSRFKDALERGRANRRMSIRHRQYQLALAGNVSMLIWLGKQDCGQRDKKELVGAEGGPLFDQQTLDDRAKLTRERLLIELDEEEDETD